MRRLNREWRLGRTRLAFEMDTNACFAGLQVTPARIEFGLLFGLIVWHRDVIVQLAPEEGDEWEDEAETADGRPRLSDVPPAKPALWSVELEPRPESAWLGREFTAWGPKPVLTGFGMWLAHRDEDGVEHLTRLAQYDRVMVKPQP